MNIYSKLVGTLIRARKYNHLTFKGELLLQHRDEDVVIKLFNSEWILKFWNKSNNLIQFFSFFKLNIQELFQTKCSFCSDLSSSGCDWACWRFLPGIKFHSINHVQNLFNSIDVYSLSTVYWIDICFVVHICCILFLLSKIPHIISNNKEIRFFNRRHFQMSMREKLRLFLFFFLSMRLFFSSQWEINNILHSLLDQWIFDDFIASSQGINEQKKRRKTFVCQYRSFDRNSIYTMIKIAIAAK